LQKFANIWVFGTLFLFYFGPIPWEGARDGWVALVVLTAMLGLNLGCMSIASSAVCTYSTVVPARLVITKISAYAVIIVFILLSANQVYNSTGLSFISPSSWSVDFGEVYTEFQENTRIARVSTPLESLMSLIKAALFPVALVIFCYHFLKDRILAALFIFPMIGSSFMRGTDKETFDVLVICIISAFYSGYKRKIIIGSAVLVPAFLFLFIERKLGRREDLPACFEFVCISYDGILSAISPKLEFGLAMITLYITNGYQGLSVALTVPFEFHFGLGHLPPIERLVCSLTRMMCDISTYDQRITDAGWDAAYRWTTLFPTLANDIHFVLIPVYMFFMGRIMRGAEILWQNERNPVALATLIMFSIFFAYLSANMQVAISLDWAVAWIVFVYIPIMTLKVRRRSQLCFADRKSSERARNMKRPLRLRPYPPPSRSGIKAPCSTGIAGVP
jgi:hypothetical protein